MSAVRAVLGLAWGRNR